VYAKGLAATEQKLANKVFKKINHSWMMNTLTFTIKLKSNRLFHMKAINAKLRMNKRYM